MAMVAGFEPDHHFYSAHSDNRRYHVADSGYRQEEVICSIAQNAVNCLDQANRLLV